MAATRSLNETGLSRLNALSSRANVRAILDVWSRNATNPNEDFWQEELAKHRFVLSFLFAYPIIVIREKAYVGGKEYDNRHGNLVDFLARVPTSRNAVLLENKTPVTPVLGTQYRQDVFPPSTELIGPVPQVIHYKDPL